MVGGRVKGTGHEDDDYCWPPARTANSRGNDRTPQGRDAKRLGGADGAGERDPTNGRGPPKTCESSFDPPKSLTCCGHTNIRCG